MRQEDNAMSGENKFLISVSKVEQKVIEDFVDLMNNITETVDNDDVWDVMESIACGRIDTNHPKIVIRYK